LSHSNIAAAGVHALAASIGVDHALGAQDIAAILAIGFPIEFQIRQIAQDGVQFAPQNYQQQPLLNLVPRQN
jgi:hypothetical protein